MKGSSVLDHMRAICLALPDTKETLTWGQPHFRVGEKIFAGCGEEKGRVVIGFKLDMDHADAVIQDPRFWRAPYVGHKGWVSMDAGGVDDWDEVRPLVLESYRLIAPRRTVAKLDGGAAPAARRRRRKRAKARRAEDRRGRPTRKTARKAAKTLARAPGMNPQGKLAILVGGGPAPGHQQRHRRRDHPRVPRGRRGARHPRRLRVDHAGRHRPRHARSTIDDVSRIHFRGGSQLGISRANPTKDPQLLENAVLVAARGSASRSSSPSAATTPRFSAMKLAEAARGRLRVVHVPKTIDNDLDLPADVDTFGFQTARHIGVEIVKNLMVDAKTTSRWYFVIAMGRKAGHLALGIGKAAGATLTLIPEEFCGAPHPPQDGRRHARRRRSSSGSRTGARDGVAVLAEGLVLSIDPADLARLDDVERDAHGHVRIAEVDFGDILKAQVQRAPQAASGSRRRSWPRTSATSCAAPTRSRSTWSTRATSATARPSTCSPAAPGR